MKPAVGVFDLASRTTEGIRHTAYGSHLHDEEEVVYDVSRIRIPRHFGKNGVVFPYHLECAAAQYMGDKLIGFSREPRILVLYHQNIVRRIKGYESQTLDNKINQENKDKDNIQTTTPSTAAVTTSSAAVTTLASSPLRLPAIDTGASIYKDIGYEDYKIVNEYWGMNVGQSYVVLISLSKIILASVKRSSSSTSSGKTNNEMNKRKSFSLIWSCPARLINQFCCDKNGDLLLSLSLPVSTAGNW